MVDYRFSKWSIFRKTLQNSEIIGSSKLPEGPGRLPPNHSVLPLGPLHSRIFFILPRSSSPQPFIFSLISTASSLQFQLQNCLQKISIQGNLSIQSDLTMDIRFAGLDSPLIHVLHNMLDGEDYHGSGDKSASAPTMTYVRDARAMAATPADIKEYPNSYVFVVDMPGLKSGDIKVQIEEGNALLISGERKREEEEKEGVKYVRMERRMGKLMRKFVLPENVDTDKIAAVCQDGVLKVTVEKVPPPEPKKPRTIEVKIA